MSSLWKTNTAPPIAAASDPLAEGTTRTGWARRENQRLTAAIDLGYHGVARIRAGPTPPSVPVIESLNEVPAIIARVTGTGTHE